MPIPSTRWLLLLAALHAITACLACSSEPTDQSPEGAVELFLTAMRETAHDPGAQQRAYRLLARGARRALAARARRAGELAGRDFPPESMLVAGRLRYRFRPGMRMRPEVQGVSGVVVVGGEDGRSARVPVVREDAGWRVVLEVPPLGADRGARD